MTGEKESVEAGGGTGNQPLVQKALWAHSSIGLMAAALLYLVCLTGTLTVFHEEWQRFEQPDAPEMSAIAPDAVQAAVAAVLASEREQARTTHLYVHLPVEALPRTTVTTDHQAVHVDRDGRMVVPEENGWAEFLLDLHYRLHLPSMLGLTIVGALGVMVVALSLSGLLAHPRIFRDAFRLRARDTGGVGLVDWHNRLGVWTLPFTLAIALTGAMIGLGSVNGYGLAAGFYKGDLEAVYAPIFGGEAKPDLRPAALPEVAAVLRDIRQRFPDVRPIYVVLHDPMTVGQHVQIIAEHPFRLIYGETYDYDARGRFIGTAGLSDGALGQQLAASTYNLHFGNYGGLSVKIAYAVFGLALTVVTATGVSIWLAKRRRRGVDDSRLRPVWDAVVWGVPLALAVCLVTRLVIGNAVSLPVLFWSLAGLILLAAVALHGYWKPRQLLPRLLVGAVAVCVASSALS